MAFVPKRDLQFSSGQHFQYFLLSRSWLWQPRIAEFEGLSWRKSVARVGSGLGFSTKGWLFQAAESQGGGNDLEEGRAETDSQTPNCFPDGDDWL